MMRRLRGLIALPKRGSFLANLAVLMSWGLAAQAVNFLVMPLLTRTYEPSQFGLFSIFTNVSVLLGVVAAMRYEYAIVLPESEREAALVVWLAVDAAVGFAAAVTIFLLLFGHSVAQWSVIASIGPWLLWLPVTIVLLAAYNAQSYWAIRHRDYARLGLSKVVIAICTAAVQLVAAKLWGTRTGGLLAGLIAGQVAGGAYLAWGSRVPTDLASRWREITALATKYSHFPRYSAIGSGLDGVSQLLPVALLTTAFGAAVGGQFALADRAMRMPSVLLGSSLAQVFFQRLSQSRKNPPECRRLLLRTWKHLAAVGGPPIIIAMIIGPWLFALVFGAQWREAGLVARALAPGVFAYFVAFPTSNVIVAFERVGLLLLWQVGYVATVGAVLVLGPRLPHLDRLAVIWMFSAALTLLHGASLCLQWYVVGSGVPSVAESVAVPAPLGTLT